MSKAPVITPLPFDQLAKAIKASRSVYGHISGLPSISLPLAQHENGLPLGIQAMARQANDGLLLQLAAQIERAVGGQWNSGRTPKVHVTNS